MTKGRSYINSYADGIMRKNMIEEVGTLLDLMMNEDMMTPKEIHMEFGVDPKTIAALRKKKTSITFESIRKFCYVIGYYLMKEEAARERKIRWGRDKEQKKKDEMNEIINKLKERYEKIYGMMASFVEDLYKKKDLRQVVKNESLPG